MSRTSRNRSTVPLMTKGRPLEVLTFILSARMRMPLSIVSQSKVFECMNFNRRISSKSDWSMLYANEMKLAEVTETPREEHAEPGTPSPVQATKIVAGPKHLSYKPVIIEGSMRNSSPPSRLAIEESIKSWDRHERVVELSEIIVLNGRCAHISWQEPQI
mmetsp:Transcript_37909/g.113283  ORF Transcript_37909/g.113283 Transcript_37909/m.113283 type:complete len:160 (+) Transcript_37909:651-1130(+)